MYIKNEATHTIMFGDNSEKDVLPPSELIRQKNFLALLLDGSCFFANGKIYVRQGTDRNGWIITNEEGVKFRPEDITFWSPMLYISNLKLNRDPSQIRFFEALDKNIEQMKEQREKDGLFDKLKGSHNPICVPDYEYFIKKYQAIYEGKSGAAFEKGMMDYAHEFLSSLEISIAKNSQYAKAANIPVRSK